MKGAFEYQDGTSILHKLNPISKLLFSISICVTCFATNNFYVLLAMIAIDLSLGFIGGIGKQTLHLFKGLLKMSIFLFVLQLFFIRSGNILVRFPLNIYITGDGVRNAIYIVLRFICPT